jgi:hypothetical protein
VDLQGKEIKSWHRTNVSRVADLLAIRIGRATSQGRPIMWSPRPELIQGRRWVGLKRPRSSRPTAFLALALCLHVGKCGYPRFFTSSLHEQIMDFAPLVETGLPQRFTMR